MGGTPLVPESVSVETIIERYRTKIVVRRSLEETLILSKCEIMNS